MTNPRSSNNNANNSNNNNKKTGSTVSNNSNTSNSSNRRGSRRRAHKKYPKTEPFAEDRQQSRVLEQALLGLGVYDTPEGLTRRQETLDALEEILNRWCDESRPSQQPQKEPTTNNNNNNNGKKKKSNNNNNKQNARVTLVTFGSYRLGVHSPHADMDVLALSPPHCSRGAFFDTLVKMLRDDDRISGVHPIQTAYTPVVKFTLLGVAVDLLFARLTSETKLLEHQKRVAASNNKKKKKSTTAGTTATTRIEYAIDDSDLLGLDEPGVRSLNGARVAQLLLETVPNLDNYRTTLRAVKEWAAVHGLYSNVLGFLGGINYAILVACICKRHRDAKPATLLKAFFHTYATWNWPTPVVLPPGISRQPPPGVSPLTVWDDKANQRDRMHLMPILTPAYPTMNSSYNVGWPQLRRMTSEFRNASAIITGIEKGTNKWTDLFQGGDFFRRHANYLQVNISANDGASFLEWFRLVESRLRLLIAGLEAHDLIVNPEPIGDFGPHDYRLQVEPSAKFFERKYDANGRCRGFGKSDPDAKHESCFFVGLRFPEHVESVDPRYCLAEFLHVVDSWEGRRLGMDVSMAMVLQRDLPEYILNGGSAQQKEIKSTGDENSNSESENNSFGPNPADDSSQGSDDCQVATIEIPEPNQEDKTDAKKVNSQSNTRSGKPRDSRRNSSGCDGDGSGVGDNAKENGCGNSGKGPKETLPSPTKRARTQSINGE